MRRFGVGTYQTNRQTNKCIAILFDLIRRFDYIGIKIKVYKSTLLGKPTPQMFDESARPLLL